MKKHISLIFSALFLLSVSPAANAVLTLQLSDDGTNWTSIEDDSGLDGLDTIAGAVNYGGSLGSWSVVVSTGIVSDGPPWTLHLDTVAYGSGSLYTMLTMTDVNLGNSPYNVNNSYTTDGAVDLTAYIDTANTTPTALTDLAGMEMLAGYGGTPSGPFSVTLLGVISHAKFGISSYDHEVEIPEPGALALLGLGLLGFGLARRRRNA